MKNFKGHFLNSVINKTKTKAAEIFNAQGGGTHAQLDAITTQQFEKWFIRCINDFTVNNIDMGIYFLK